MAPALCDARRLAATYGITVESLRLYEARGLLQPVLVNDVKYYTPRDRTRLEIVLKGRRLGFSLEEIERLVSETSSSRAAVSFVADRTRPLDLDRVVGELRALLSERDGLDASIDELTALLARK